MLAMATQILLGKNEKWKKLVLDKMNGQRKEETDAICGSEGVHER